MTYKITNRTDCQRIVRDGGRLVTVEAKKSVVLERKPVDVPADIFDVKEEVKKNG